MRKLWPKTASSFAALQMGLQWPMNQSLVRGDQRSPGDEKAKSGASGGTRALTRRWFCIAFSGQRMSCLPVRVSWPPFSRVDFVQGRGIVVADVEGEGEMCLW